MTLKTAATKFGSEAEYKALRDEILTRIRLRQQIVISCLAFCGVLFGFALDGRAILTFVYPMLAAYLGISWIHNDLRIFDMSEYIRNKYEILDKNGNMPFGWESHIKTLPGYFPMRPVVFAHGGLFVTTQCFAIILGWILLYSLPDGPSNSDWWIAVGMTTIGIASIVFLYITLRKTRRSKMD